MDFVRKIWSLMPNNRRDKLNRRQVDPELLREYDNLRNKRRMSNYLLPLSSVGMVIFLLTFVIVMRFNISGFTRTIILIGVSGIYLVICFGLMIVWSPAGKRLWTFGIILVFLTVISIIGIVITCLMKLLLL